MIVYNDEKSMYVNETPWNTIVLFDENNLDSITAFACFAIQDLVNVSESIALSTGQKPVSLKDKRVIVLGVQLNKDMATMIHDHAESIEVWSYKNTLENKIVSLHKEYVHYWACFDNEDTTLPDEGGNSIMALLYEVYPAIVQAVGFEHWVVPISRYINIQSFPREYKFPIERDTNNWFIPWESAALLDLERTIKSYIYGGKDFRALKEYVPTQDMEAYMEHYHRTRADVHKLAHRSLFTGKKGTYSIMSMNVAPERFMSALRHVMMSHGSFVGYCDMEYGREWRVYSREGWVIEEVKHSLTPSQMWEEGVVTVMLTKRII